MNKTKFLIFFLITTSPCSIFYFCNGLITLKAWNTEELNSFLSFCHSFCHRAYILKFFIHSFIESANLYSVLTKCQILFYILGAWQWIRWIKWTNVFYSNILHDHFTLELLQSSLIFLLSFHTSQSYILSPY